MKILAIETTCDETAAAVVTSGPEVLSDIVYSQIKEQPKIMVKLWLNVIFYNFRICAYFH